MIVPSSQIWKHLQCHLDWTSLNNTLARIIDTHHLPPAPKHLQNLNKPVYVLVLGSPDSIVNLKSVFDLRAEQVVSVTWIFLGVTG